MPNRTPEILDQITAVAESNNRDYDEQGRPVTSSAGARFAMQVMPATARDPGFGLRPADPNNAEDMNRLGREYRATMERRYGGDLAKMWAAYNAGPGRVDSAIQRYGSDWLRGMPSETQNYVRNNMSAAGGRQVSGSNRGNDPSRFLEGLESSLGPEQAASQNVRVNGSKTFGSDEELSRRQANVEDATNRQMEGIQTLGDVMDATQLATREALTRQVESTRAVNDEMSRGTQALKEKVAPVFRARQEIADQLDRINEMNPLERGIRGIFDLNYNQDHLTERLDAYDRTLAARSQDYEYLQALQTDAISQFNTRYSTEVAIPSLLQQQASEDLTLLGQALSTTSTQLGNLQGEIAMESQMVRAKAAMREDLMTELDLPTRVRLVQEAEANGGIVNYEGVELTYAGLRRSVENSEQRAAQLESYRNAAVLGRMEYADRFATEVIRGMSRKEIEDAIANDGKVGDTQLPMDRLTSYLRQAIERDATMANVEVARNRTLNIQRSAGAVVQQQVTALRRMIDMGSGAGLQTASGIMNNSTASLRKLQNAIETGQPPETIQAYAMELQESTAAFDQEIQRRAAALSGGNKDSEGFIYNYLKGERLTPGAAMDAVIHFGIRGSLPEGLAANPTARGVFSRVSQLAAEIREDEPKISAARLRERISATLAEEIPNLVAGDRFNTIYQNLPEVASEIDHPFKNMPMSRWATIRAAASEHAINAMAGQYQIDYNEMKSMMDNQRPFDSSEKAREVFEKFSTTGGQQFNALEMTNLVMRLDREPAVAPGTSNSELLEDLFNDPRLAVSGSRQFERHLGANSFADYVMNPIARGALGGRVGDQADFLRQGQQSHYASQRQITNNPQLSLVGRPEVRIPSTMAAIEGVGLDGARRMLPYVNEFVESGQAGVTFSVDSITMMQRQDTAFVEYLSRLQIEDPAIDSYRKKIVAGMPEAATRSLGFIDSVGRVAGELLNLTPPALRDDRPANLPDSFGD